MKIITKYILKEILTPFGITLTVFTLIFILGNLMQLIEMIVQKGVGIFNIVRLLGYTLPFLMVYIIPMSFFISILLGFLRLASDNESHGPEGLGNKLLSVVAARIDFELLRNDPHRICSHGGPALGGAFAEKSTVSGRRGSGQSQFKRTGFL